MSEMDKYEIRQVLASIARSPGTGGGWREVSKQLWPIVQDMPLSLVSLRPYSGGGGAIRLTESGRAVLEYS